MSGAINFIMKRDFEGVAIGTDMSQTGESDGRIKSASLTVGTNVAEGRGNIVFGVNWSEREGVQLGARPLGQLGIVTEDGSGLEEFLNGEAPPPAPAGCGGPGSVAAGGSTTTLPTRVAIAGGPGLGQFRDDGTLGTNCSVFNFNPFNYYQTPQTRFGGTALGRFEVNEHAEVYGRLAYSSTNVRQQIAPSGVFATPFWTPLSNPLISAQARGVMIATGEAGRVAGTVIEGTGRADPAANWDDVDNSGTVTAGDYLNISYRRRTVEFGERSTTFDNNAWSFVAGVTGEIAAGWTYDVSYQRGESDRTNTDAGYTNVTNLGLAVDCARRHDLRFRRRVRPDQPVRRLWLHHPGNGRVLGCFGAREPVVHPVDRRRVHQRRNRRPQAAHGREWPGAGVRHRISRRECRDGSGRVQEARSGELPWWCRR